MRPSLHPAVAAALAYLEDAPEHPWRLPELANRVGLDPDYFGRLFRRDTGQSPIDYLARVRVERAAHLLTRSKLPVSRVGARVGWGDPTYFARRFRQLTGITPTAYRLDVSRRLIAGD